MSEGDDTYQVDRRLCIGCGVCLESCPVDAIALQPKPETERVASPVDIDSWMEQRGAQRVGAGRNDTLKSVNTRYTYIYIYLLKYYACTHEDSIYSRRHRP